MKTFTYLKSALVLTFMLVTGVVCAQQAADIPFLKSGGNDGIRQKLESRNLQGNAGRVLLGKKSGLKAPAKAGEVEGEVNLCYSNGDVYPNGVGIKEEGAQMSAAVFFSSGTMSQYIGRKLSAISFGISKDSLLSNISVFIMDNHFQVLYSQQVNSASVGWNEVLLDTPFPIDGRGILVGYSLYCVPNNYPISFDQSETSYGNACYLCVGDDLTRWNDYSDKNWGSLNISATLSAFTPTLKVVNKTPAFTYEPEQTVSAKVIALSEISSFTAELSYGENSYSQQIDKALSVNDSCVFSFESKIPLKENETIPYYVRIKTIGSDGAHSEIVARVQGSISRYSSEYYNAIETTDYGQLGNMFTQMQRDTITSLIIYGYMNSSDFSMINYNMPRLKNLNLANVYIEDYKSFNFQNNGSIEKVVLPSSYLALVPDYAFNNCTSLKEVSLPEGLQAIGDGAFWRCTSLKKINLPEGLQRIGENAFRECTSLKEINLPEGLQTIESNSFQSCISLSGELILPSTLTTIGNDAFNDCVGFTVCRSKAVTPPTIGSKDYYNPLGNVTIVYVPKGSAESYRKDPSWSQMTIIDGDELVSVSVKLDKAGTLGEKVLAQVEYLNSVNELIVSGPLNDADWKQMKEAMTSLVSIDLSATTATSIPNSQFQNRYGLQTVLLPANLTVIGNSSFSSCTALTTIEIPATVVTIGNNVFNNCQALNTATLPADLKTLGNDSFSGCSSLKSVVIPQGVSLIGSSAFYNCYKLSEVIFSENVTLIKSQAFYGCTSLKTVTLPSRLTTLEYGVFNDCPLDSITLPATLTTIDSYSLNCETIKRITCLQPTPPILNNGDPFNDVNKATCELVVPAWAENMYKLADIWNLFANVSTYEKEIENLPVSGVLTLAENVRPVGMPSVDILPTGRLTVHGNQPFATNRFTMTHNLIGQKWNDWSNALFANLVNESSSMTAESAEMNFSIAGNKWFYFSFPYDIAMSDVTIDEGKFFVFRKYDGASRATIGVGDSWKNMASEDILRAGTGYIFQCSADVNKLVLKATGDTKNKLFESSMYQVPLTDYVSENTEDRSWNFVGNPFPSYFDIRYVDYVAPITIWNDNSRNYEALSLIDDQYVLRPFEAFFVQKPTDVASINFLPKGRQMVSTINNPEKVMARTAQANPDRKIINLSLKNESYSDKCRIVINPEAEGDYELNCDAAKFMSTEIEVPQIYSLDGKGVNYAINERPEGDGIIPLGIYIGASGSYTFAMQPISTEDEIALVDKVANMEINLKESDYTFDAEEGVNNERFQIRFKAGTSGCDTEQVLPVRVNSGRGTLSVTAAAGTSLRIATYTGITVKEIITTESHTEIVLPQGTYIVIVNGKAHKVIVL